MEDFGIKSSEYMVYLVPIKNSPKLVKSEFDKAYSIPTHQARKKIEKYFEIKVIFT